jgi:hypothetical protein
MLLPILSPGRNQDARRLKFLMLPLLWLPFLHKQLATIHRLHMLHLHQTESQIKGNQRWPNTSPRVLIRFVQQMKGGRAPSHRRARCLAIWLGLLIYELLRHCPFGGSLGMSSRMICCQ